MYFSFATRSIQPNQLFISGIIYDTKNAWAAGDYGCLFCQQVKKPQKETITKKCTQQGIEQKLWLDRFH